MDKQWMGTAALCAALVTAPIPVHAQGVDLGQREYANSCAVCHGERGKGDGRIVIYLKTAPADLTILQKNNKGVFPFGRVYEIIDGRTAVPAHGTRAMPVWGDRFKEYNSELAELRLKFGTRVDSEAFVRDRILALIRYISGLQEK